MAHSTEEFLRIVLIGKTGVGKGEVGNSLLNEIYFKSSTKEGSLTSECQIGTCRIDNGTNVVIVDTPGIVDTSKSNIDTSKEIVRCIGLSSPGPHAFVFVLKIGAKCTAEGIDTIQSFKNMFGQRVMNFVIVVFTGKDNLEAEGLSIEEYLGDAPAELLSLIAECHGRYVAINNRAPIDVLVKDVEEIFRLIKRTIDENGGEHYAGEMYTAAEEAFEEMNRICKEGENNLNEIAIENGGADMEERRQIAEVEHGEPELGAVGRKMEVVTESEGLAEWRKMEKGQKHRTDEMTHLESEQICVASEMDQHKSETGAERRQLEVTECLTGLRLEDKDQRQTEKLVQLSYEQVNQREIESEVREMEQAEKVEGLVELWTIEDTEQGHRPVELKQLATVATEAEQHEPDMECEDLKLAKETEGLTELRTEKDQLKQMIKQEMEESRQMQSDKVDEESKHEVAKLEEDMQRESKEDKRQNTSLPEEMQEIRVILVGKTGVGKSHVGNNLLNKKHFITSLLPSSTTSKCKFGTRKLEDGTKLVIVDTPGIFDTSKSNIITSKEIVRCIGLSSPGPHAFVFVLKIGTKFTKEERDAITNVKDIFGKDVMNYGLVVFTGKDNLEEEGLSMEEYLVDAPVENGGADIEERRQVAERGAVGKKMEVVTESEGLAGWMKEEKGQRRRTDDMTQLASEQIYVATDEEAEGLSMEEYLGDAPVELLSLIAECSGRYAAINNRASVDVLVKDVEDIFRLIRRTMDDNGGEHYTGEMYAAAERAFKENMKLLEDEKHERERELDRKEQELEKEHLKRRKRIENEMEERRKIVEAEQQQRELELVRETERLAKVRLEEEQILKSRELELKQLVDEQKDERRKMQEDMRDLKKEVKEEREKMTREIEYERKRQRDKEEMRRHEMELRRIDEKNKAERKELERERERLQELRLHFREDVQNTDNFVMRGLKVVAKPVIYAWKTITRRT